MKKTSDLKMPVITLVAVLIMIAEGIKGQEYITESSLSEPAMMLKTNPLAMIQGPVFVCSEYRLCAERGTRKGQSMQISGSYLGKSYSLLLGETMMENSYRFVVSGFRVTAEYRFFTSLIRSNGQNLSGLYFAPYVSWASATVSDDYSINFNEYIKATYQNLCIKAGYQYIKGRFVIDFFTGAGYRNNVWTEHENYSFSVLNNDDMEPFPGHFKFLLGFNAGVCF
jgi:hypothetical protein